MSSGDEKGVVSRVFLIRHGDRFDYANESWAEKAKEHGVLLTDPPLSALGHRQAKETADHLLDMLMKRFADDRASKLNDDHNGVAKILSSPYLRVIQTAVPTSDALKLPISIEFGLSEAHATPGAVLPSPKERFAYFPHVDPSYDPILRDVKPTPGFRCRKTGHPCEAFAGRYAQRMEALAQKLETVHKGKTIVCFSHAASVALVAAFLKCSMRDLKFAPCGIFELQRTDDGPWELIRSGGDNHRHVSENSPSTYPWGLEEKHFMEGKESHYHGNSEEIGLDYFVPRATR